MVLVVLMTASPGSGVSFGRVSLCRLPLVAGLGLGVLVGLPEVAGAVRLSLPGRSSALVFALRGCSTLSGDTCNKGHSRLSVLVRQSSLTILRI